MTDAGCFIVLTVDFCRYRLWVYDLLTVWALGLMSRNILSSENMTFSQSSPVMKRCFLQNASRFRTIAGIRRGFVAAELAGKPSLFFRVIWIRLTDTALSLWLVEKTDIIFKFF